MVLFFLNIKHKALKFKFINVYFSSFIEKLMNFTKSLTDWYSINKREMPWRNTKNPYNIWLSEIILQQTQVKQGLPYYEVFVAKFPTVHDLASASEETVLKHWQGLGYYSRARNLHATAKHISKDLKGDFPTTYEELLKLKGIGDYTASAIASICFNESRAVVDGNVYRVLSRFFGIHTPINSTLGIKEFKALAQSLIDTDNPGDYNQAIMEFGAIQCKPNNPDCSVCPLNNNCYALKNNLISKLPVKLKKAKVKKRYFNYLVFISEQNETILQKRTEKGIWQNLFEFPLIESDSLISENELQKHPKLIEIVTNDVFEIKKFNNQEIVHKLSHQHLHTTFWIISIENLNGASVPISELFTYPVPVLISNFIEAYF